MTHWFLGSRAPLPSRSGLTGNGQRWALGTEGVELFFEAFAHIQNKVGVSRTSRVGIQQNMAVLVRFNFPFAVDTRVTTFYLLSIHCGADSKVQCLYNISISGGKTSFQVCKQIGFETTSRNNNVLLVSRMIQKVQIVFCKVNTLMGFPQENEICCISRKVLVFFFEMVLKAKAHNQCFTEKKGNQFPRKSDCLGQNATWAKYNLGGGKMTLRLNGWMEPNQIWSLR